MGDAGEMNLGWESVKGFAGKVVQAVFGFIGTILFARILGPTDFGGFYFLLSLVFITDRPIRGFGQAIEKRYSEAGSDTSEIAGSVLAVNTLVFLVAAVAVFVFDDYLRQTTNVEDAPVVFLSLFIALGLFFPIQKMLGGEGWISKQTWNDTLRSVLTLPLQLGFVLAGFGAAGMGYGLAAATLLVVPVGLYFLRIRPSLPSRKTLRSIWGYAKFSTPAAFVGKAYDRFDVLLLGALLTTSAVGYYEVAFKLTVPATFFSLVITSGLLPKVSNRYSKGQDIATDVTNAIAYTSLFSIPLFFGTLAIPDALVITAYSQEYAEAAPLLIGLGLYQVLATQTQIYQCTLGGIDRPDVQLRINGLTLGFNIIVGIVLLMRFDALGVVVATILAETLRYGLSMYAVRRRTSGINVVPRTLFEQVSASVIMFLIVKMIQGMITLQSWTQLALIVGSGVVVYGTVLLIISSNLRFTLLSIYNDNIIKS